MWHGVPVIYDAKTSFESVQSTLVTHSFLSDGVTYSTAPRFNRSHPWCNGVAFLRSGVFPSDCVGSHTWPLRKYSSFFRLTTRSLVELKGPASAHKADNDECHSHPRSMPSQRGASHALGALWLARRRSGEVRDVPAPNHQSCPCTYTEQLVLQRDSAAVP